MYLGISVLTKSGKIRYIDDRTLIRRNKEGKITYYQGIIVDITERKLAEEMVKGQNMVLGKLASGAPLEEVLLPLIRSMERSDLNPYAR
ncbi:PAS domain S-box protein [Methanosarcina horonobensis]|uniref:PAS domain S-box protein n=1 Tax=Methanosarcina horonobensis TaxID=418008 RepID=UPI000B108922|nr:PAS domain S-box protein [Methanosarcina horonobensis]